MGHLIRPPVIWGAVWGGIQAASPLAFWWLDALDHARDVERGLPAVGELVNGDQSGTVTASSLVPSSQSLAKRARCRVVAGFEWTTTVASW
jgi:hypothetical protein